MVPELLHETVDVMGVRVSVADVPLLQRYLTGSIGRRQRLTITFANPNYVMAARKDPRLRALMNSFDLNLADGWGVVLATKIFGKPVPGRMANDDLTEVFFGMSAREGWRAFLFGNAPGVADAAADNLRQWYPGVEIVGTQHGHWADASGRIPADVAERLVMEINEAKPDILHVGLGTPLQQTFVTEHRDRLDVPVIVTCGAYFEHLAERREYYPPLAVTLRICWLYRLYRDPRAYWHRYTVELGSYVVRVLAYRLRHGKQR